MSASAKLRVLRCLWILLSGWHTKSQVAEELGVCTRSVGRYLANIQDAGFSVQVAGDEGPYEQLYRVEQDVFYEPANEPVASATKGGAA